jgi:hypothetical protein
MSIYIPVPAVPALKPLGLNQRAEHSNKTERQELELQGLKQTPRTLSAADLDAAAQARKEAVTRSRRTGAQIRGHFDRSGVLRQQDRNDRTPTIYAASRAAFAGSPRHQGGDREREGEAEAGRRTCGDVGVGVGVGGGVEGLGMVGGHPDPLPGAPPGKGGRPRGTHRRRERETRTKRENTGSETAPARLRWLKYCARARARRARCCGDGLRPCSAAVEWAGFCVGLIPGLSHWKPSQQP